jgi:hypothetical protein
LGQYTADGITISGANLYIGNLDSGTIGEYTTSGGTVTSALVSGLRGPFAMAISGTNLFVTSYGSGTVGQYTTAGAAVNTSLISGLNGPFGITISETNLFITVLGDGTVDQFTTSGQPVNVPLLSGLSEPSGIAIGPGPLRFTGINISGHTLNINAVNGPPGGTFTLLQSTNVSLPLTNWTAVLTNTFDSNGNVSLSTNVVSRFKSVDFYILAVP